jgi:hypothetical protein
MASEKVKKDLEDKIMELKSKSVDEKYILTNNDRTMDDFKKKIKDIQLRITSFCSNPSPGKSCQGQMNVPQFDSFLDKTGGEINHSELKISLDGLL